MAGAAAVIGPYGWEAAVIGPASCGKYTIYPTPPSLSVRRNWRYYEGPWARLAAGLLDLLELSIS